MAKTYTNFTDVATALGFKIKKKAAQELTMACPNCGNEMRNVPGTNVWLCEWASLADETTKDGTAVQVFTRCENRVLASN